MDARRNAKAALAIEKQYGLPAHAPGRGRRDPVWKMLGSMKDTGMAVPLVAVIDTAGVLRYAGGGGAELEDARRALEKAARRSR